MNLKHNVKNFKNKIKKKLSSLCYIQLVNE